MGQRKVLEKVAKSFGQGKYNDVVSIATEFLNSQRGNGVDDDTLQLQDYLAEAFNEIEQFTTAEHWSRKTLEVRKMRPQGGVNDRRICRTRGDLAVSLFEQYKQADKIIQDKKYLEAIGLLQMNLTGGYLKAISVADELNYRKTLANCLDKLGDYKGSEYYFNQNLSLIRMKRKELERRFGENWVDHREILYKNRISQARQAQWKELKVPPTKATQGATSVPGLTNFHHDDGFGGETKQESDDFQAQNLPEIAAEHNSKLQSSRRETLLSEATPNQSTHPNVHEQRNGKDVNGHPSLEASGSLLATETTKLGVDEPRASDGTPYDPLDRDCCVAADN